MSTCSSSWGTRTERGLPGLDWHHGYLLHCRPWRETSLWLEAFTREAGKVALIAKGGRRHRRFAARLQPFQPLLLQWRRRGELANLTVAESGGPSFGLQGTALFCGFYVNELLCRLLARDDPHPGLFDGYQRVLLELAEGKDVEAGLRRFELTLLVETGYAPVLDHEVEYGIAIDAEKRYRYLPERGPVADANGWLHGLTLLELGTGRLSTPRSRAEAKRLLRLLIEPHLQGRPLQSRSLFCQLREHESQIHSSRR